MKYRVILKVGYYERWFEFDTVDSAAYFAKDLLSANVPNEDHPEIIAAVSIVVIKKEDEKCEEE